MSKLKKYPITYEQKAGSNTPGSNNFFQCKILPESDYENLSLNPNLINITFRGVTKAYILSTGHSIGPYACKINRQDIEPDLSLSNVITNSGKYYSLNDTKFDRDFSLISHDIIGQIPRTVSFPGKFDNLAIPVTCIDLEPDKNKTYYKYGKTTGVTSAKIYLMLQKPRAKQLLSECKIKSGKHNIYQIPDYTNGTLTVISHASNGIDDNIANKDFLLTHDESFYINPEFDESLQIEPNFQLYIYLAGFLGYLGYESNESNKKVLLNLIKSHGIGTKWFEAQRIGWVSLMGDSGSGFYSVNTDESGTQSAQLAGINVEGCTMIKVRQIKKPKELMPNIFVYWDDNKSQLIIGNYEILSAQKCSLAHSISRIEQVMRDLTGETLLIS